MSSGYYDEDYRKDCMKISSYHRNENDVLMLIAKQLHCIANELHDLNTTQVVDHVEINKDGIEFKYRD